MTNFYPLALTNWAGFTQLTSQLSMRKYASNLIPLGNYHAAPALGIIAFVFRESKKRAKSYLAAFPAGVLAQASGNEFAKYIQKATLVSIFSLPFSAQPALFSAAAS